MKNNCVKESELPRSMDKIYKVRNEVSDLVQSFNYILMEIINLEWSIYPELITEELVKDKLEHFDAIAKECLEKLKTIDWRS